MAELTSTSHWTERATKDFLIRIATDFARQIEIAMEVKNISRQELARRLGVSKGSVSQSLNNPGNLTLGKIIAHTRALGLKAAVIAYDDGDPQNMAGPINAQVFTTCWESMGKPRDAFDLEICPRVFYQLGSLNAVPTTALTATREQFSLPFTLAGATSTTHVSMTIQ